MLGDTVVKGLQIKPQHKKPKIISNLFINARIIFFKFCYFIGFNHMNLSFVI